MSNYKGEKLQYKDVVRRIEKLHIVFEECGLKKGDKVAICARNQANWAVVYLATLTYGAVVVPILYEFLKKIMAENLRMINEEQSNYVKVARIQIFPEEFEKAPKKSIKRYLYQ